MKRTNRDYTIDKWWYNIWLLNGYRVICAKTRLHKMRWECWQRFLLSESKLEQAWSDVHWWFIWVHKSLRGSELEHDKSIPYRSETNGIVGRAVKRIKIKDLDSASPVRIRWKIVVRSDGMLWLRAFTKEETTLHSVSKYPFGTYILWSNFHKKTKKLFQISSKVQ